MDSPQNNRASEVSKDDAALPIDDNFEADPGIASPRQKVGTGSKFMSKDADDGIMAEEDN